MRFRLPADMRAPKEKTRWTCACYAGALRRTSAIGHIIVCVCRLLYNPQLRKFITLPLQAPADMIRLKIDPPTNREAKIVDLDVVLKHLISVLRVKIHAAAVRPNSATEAVARGRSVG
jgi:hypothetical protein